MNNKSKMQPFTLWIICQSFKENAWHSSIKPCTSLPMLCETHELQILTSTSFLVRKNNFLQTPANLQLVQAIQTGADCTGVRPGRTSHLLLPLLVQPTASYSRVSNLAMAGSCLPTHSRTCISNLQPACFACCLSAALPRMFPICFVNTFHSAKDLNARHALCTCYEPWRGKSSLPITWERGTWHR